MKLTDVGRDASQDDLLLAGSLDSVAEFLVVPGVDFTLALDESSIGVRLEDLLGQGTVGALLGRGSHDGGDVEQIANLGMGHHVVAVQGRVPVARETVQADLEIKDDQKLDGQLAAVRSHLVWSGTYRIVLVETFPLNRWIERTFLSPPSSSFQGLDVLRGAAKAVATM